MPRCLEAMDQRKGSDALDAQQIISTEDKLTKAQGESVRFLNDGDANTVVNINDGAATSRDDGLELQPLVCLGLRDPHRYWMVDYYITCERPLWLGGGTLQMCSSLQSPHQSTVPDDSAPKKRRRWGRKRKEKVPTEQVDDAADSVAKTIPYFELFRYSTWTEKCMMTIGVYIYGSNHTYTGKAVVGIPIRIVTVSYICTTYYYCSSGVLVKNRRFLSLPVSVCVPYDDDRVLVIR